MKHLLGMRLWHLFKHANLTEVVRQIYKLFIKLLNNVQVGNIEDDVKKYFQARFIHESDKIYPKDALRMYAKNEPAMKRNEAFENDLPGAIYTIEANDNIPDNCK